MIQYVVLLLEVKGLIRDTFKRVLFGTTVPCHSKAYASIKADIAKTDIDIL